MTIHLCHTVFGNDKKRLSQIEKEHERAKHAGDL